MHQLRLIISTIALTLLIWAAADQSLTESREVQVTLTLQQSGSEEFHAELVAPGAHRAKINVVGPRTVVDALARKQPLQAEIPVRLKTVGVHELDLRENLAQLRPLFDGVTIESTDPEEFVVTIDRFISQTVRVEIDRGSLEFEESLRIEPETVEVILRESHWSAIREQDPHYIINIEPIVSRSPEGAIEETVALGDTLLGVAVKPRPSTVMIRGKIIRPLETVTLNTVPILFVGPADLLNSFQIIPTEEVITRTITLRGPRETLDWLQSAEQKITGFIPLSRNDTQSLGTTRSVQPQFRLPPNVKLVEDPPPVEFELRPFKISQAEEPLG